jgi:hypothetical protein
MDFVERSVPTIELGRAVDDRQDADTKLSKDELARMRYESDFDELSDETKEEISTLYRAQFTDGEG